MRSLIVGLTFLICLCLAELLVRDLHLARFLYTDPGFTVSSSSAYWSYKPGFVGRFTGDTPTSIGKFGERSHTYIATHPDLTIAITGDSVTFGQGLPTDLTYPALLEHRLRDSGLNARVLNFGVQGHTIDMAVAHLEDVYDRVLPDITVLAFTVDDLNPSRRQNRVDEYGYLTKTAFGTGSVFGDATRAALRHSQLCLLAKAAYLKTKSRLGHDWPSDQRQAQMAVGLFLKSVTAFEKQARNDNKIVLNLDPRPSALTQALSDCIRSNFPQLPYVEMWPELARYSPGSLVVPGDGHPNQTAHRIYADRLAAELLRVLGRQDAVVARKAPCTNLAFVRQPSHRYESKDKADASDYCR